MTAASLLVAFVAAAGLLTITPGLDTMLVLRTLLVEGRRAAVAAALGIQAGCFAWGCAVAVGLATVMAAAPAAYAALRWCGAAYLAYCGLTMLLKPRGELTLGSPATAAARSGARAFRRGLTTNLLNPKVGLFYLSFLPQFVPAGWPAGLTMVGLTAIHITMAILWFAILLGGAGVVRTALTTRAGLMRTLDRVTGLVFVGFGLRLALERR